jgi:lipid kinase YegS
MRWMRLILNGKAADAPGLRDAVSALREQGHKLEIRVTWESGDAERFAEEASGEGVEVVVAGGGDGTVNAVVNGLLRADDSPTALGIIPFGTANDFASSCGIPDDPASALLIAAEQKPVPIDVARANDHLFLNVASGGFTAEITASTPPELKNALGGGAYSLVGLVKAFNMTPYPSSMTGPSGEIQETILIFCVGNGRQTGGGYQVTPKAYVDDGLLDVTFIRDFPVTELGTVVSELMSPTDQGNRFVHYEQMPSFEVALTEEVPLNLDGEPTRGKRFKFDVLHRRLRFIAPRDIPLLRP